MRHHHAANVRQVARSHVLERPEATKSAQRCLQRARVRSSGFGLEPVAAGDAALQRSRPHQALGGLVAAGRVEAVAVVYGIAPALDREGRFMAAGAAGDAEVAMLRFKIEGPGDEPSLPER